MGAAFLIISLLVLFRRKHSPMPFFTVSLVFFACAFIAPILLKPVYIFWMKLAHALGWINTRLILTALFYLVFTPIALIIRLMRKDLLDVKIEKNRESYWRKKEIIDIAKDNYERQF